MVVIELVSKCCCAEMGGAQGFRGGQDQRLLTPWFISMYHVTPHMVVGLLAVIGKVPTASAIWSRGRARWTPRYDAPMCRWGEMSLRWGSALLLGEEALFKRSLDLC